MPFDNENTYIKMVERNEEDLFHKKFDESVLSVTKLFDKEYPNLVNGEVFEE